MLETKRSERHFQNALRSILILFALVFSFFLMFHTVSYDRQVQSITIASKAWSDFGAHIPLIRSFSKGANFTRLSIFQKIESPLFPGEPIRYHFGFYALVGLLEKLGVRLDIALNTLSALGFFLMLIGIFMLSFRLFTNYYISFLSVFFALFNGSFSFMNFFRVHPLSIKSVAEIVTNPKFSSFGPWDGGFISAFWTLNIFTNQRQLGLAFGLSLWILYLSIKKQSTRLTNMTYSLCIAFFMSSLIFVHFPAAVITLLFLLWFFIVDKRTRRLLFVAGLLTIPSFLLLIHTTTVGTPRVEIGYLLHPPINVFSLLQYWTYNLGLHIVLIPMGILLSPRPIRRLITVPLLLIFIIPNVFRLSPDMINNHKFFNFFMIIGSMFSAYTVVRIGRIRRIGPISLICIIFFLTLSGVIDLFPIINDSRGSVVNSDKRQDMLFFENHTNPNDIIANSTWFYHPASLAGRAIYSGYTYFTWSYGYDQGKREQELLSLYQADNLITLCSLLSTLNISYVELSKTPEDYIKPNLLLWNSIPAEYTNTDTFLRVYSKNTLCQN